MNKFALIAVSTLSLLAAAPAQDVQVFGGAGTRGSATKILFGATGCVGMVCVQYGQPNWKDEYAAMVQAKGKNFRLGKDFWTTINTSVDLTIGGVKMPAGAYYLGLHANEEGVMHLAAFDAAASDRANQGPWAPDAWKIDWVAPLTHGEVDEMASKLAINLENGDSPTDMTLEIHWGGHSLTAPVKLHLAKGSPADASGKKGADKGRDGHDGDGKGADKADAKPTAVRIRK